MVEEEKRFSEKVKEAISPVKEPNVVIPISFPSVSYKRFRKWAAVNASNCFWLAIDKLLDADEQKLDLGHEFRMLADRDEVLLNEIVRLEEKFEALKSVPAPIKKRGFGRKEEKDGTINESKE